MRSLFKGLAGLALSALLLAPGAALAQDAVDSGMTIYFQMGGNPGDSATLARELGARAAAKVLNVKLIEQHAGWNPQTMITQGTAAMTPFLKAAKDAGIVVVVNNNELPGTDNSYFGLDNYQAGQKLAQLTIDDGKLKAGDKIVVYGAFIEGAPGNDVAKGTMNVLDAQKIAYDKLQWSNEAVADPSLSVPVLIAYLQSNPDTKAIIVPGHSGITAVLGKVLEGAGKKPGDVVASGFDISPGAIQALKDGYLTVVLDQQPYLQGFMPVVAAVLQKKYGLSGMVMNTGGG